MGYDITFILLSGYKISVKKAIDIGILKSNVLEDPDDYQEINFATVDSNYTEKCYLEYKSLILIYVKSDKIKELIINGDWKIYILTSSQEDSDLENSYMYLHNECKEIYSGIIPDYKSGNIEMGKIIKEENQNKIKEILGDDVKYETHWLLEGSW